MTRAEALHKLLQLGPLQPLFAQRVCGWGPVDFDQAMKEAIQNGWIRWSRHTNQHPNLLEAL